jgi:apolipoprotein D and lipocalin family protein
MKSIMMLFCPIFGFCAAAYSQSSQPIPVSKVDLVRYAGLWYEIAKIPNFFQKQCACCTTAEYALLEDGRISVVNCCQKTDGSVDSVHGFAKIVDKQTQAKLKVSFVRFLGRNWFWGDYWIIGLDPDYQWAVVGAPNRKYGWILGRTPEMTGEIRLQVNEVLRQQGYNPDVFVDTRSK